MSCIPKFRSPFRCELGALLATLCCCWLLPLTAARADGRLGENGATIQTSNYALDLFQGPVFAGSRVTGLAGAYVAISEDVDGDLQNPAAPAVRPPFSYSDFDYWLGFGVTFPPTLNRIDFFNSGSRTNLMNAANSFVFLVPAANLQWGEFGLGATLEMQHYELSGSTPTATAQAAVAATIPTTHIQFAHGIMYNQWVLGVGARFASLSVHGGGNTPAAFASTGTGLELGMVFKPEGKPFRFGAAVRSGIRTEAAYRDGLSPDENGNLTISTPTGEQVYLPRSVALPWDVNVGVAFQLGKRPFNPPWRSMSDLAERQRLLHRLNELERNAARQKATEQAQTPAERAALERTFMEQERADDLALERALSEARRRVDAALSELNQFYVQVSVSLLIAGPVEQAVGVESLVTQVINRSGQHAVYSPRLGVESGVLPRYLRVRAGTYLEPTRFATSQPRLHGTLGFDVKLGTWSVFGLWPDDYAWRLGLSGDFSHRYYTVGLSLGGWYPRGAAAATPRAGAGAGQVPTQVSTP